MDLNLFNPLYLGFLQKNDLRVYRRPKGISDGDSYIRLTEGKQDWEHLLQ